MCELTHAIGFHLTLKSCFTNGNRRVFCLFTCCSRNAFVLGWFVSDSFLFFFFFFSGGISFRHYVWLNILELCQICYSILFYSKAKNHVHGRIWYKKKKQWKWSCRVFTKLSFLQICVLAHFYSLSLLPNYSHVKPKPSRMSKWDKCQIWGFFE